MYLTINNLRHMDIDLSGRHKVVWIGKDSTGKYYEIVYNGVLFRIYENTKHTVDYD